MRHQNGATIIGFAFLIVFGSFILNGCAGGEVSPGEVEELFENNPEGNGGNDERLYDGPDDAGPNINVPDISGGGGNKNKGGGGNESGDVGDGDGGVEGEADYSDYDIDVVGIFDALILTGGAAGEGNRNGTGREAAFFRPHRLAVSNDGSRIFVADTHNHTIRAIDAATGGVSLFAGRAGGRGNLDAPDGPATGARFDYPRGICLSPGDETLYVLDGEGNCIRKIALSSGATSTLAGDCEKAGSDDGSGLDARFNDAYGLTCDPSEESLYVGDSKNHAIRKVFVGSDAASTHISTIAGQMGAPGYADGAGIGARFNDPRDVAIDGDGKFLFVGDYSNRTIRRIDLLDPEMPVVTIAQSSSYPDFPALAYSSSGAEKYLFAVVNGSQIGRFKLDDDGNVIAEEIVAGGDNGYADAQIGQAARLNKPFGLLAYNNRLYIADTYNSSIRVADILKPDFPVDTLAGGVAISGDADGDITAASFNLPHGMAAIGGTVYVADGGNRKIRVITFDADGDGHVSTLVGGPGFADTSDGVPKFGHFYHLAQYEGDIYVADTQNTSIRRVSLNPDGSLKDVTTIAGAKPAKPGFADAVGGEARFKLPHGIVAGEGVLFVSDTYNHVIRRIDLADLGVTTVAGTPGVSGFSDSADGGVKFNMPDGLAIDDDYLYIADNLNNRVRRMDLLTHDVDTLAGNDVVATVNGVGIEASFNSPRALHYYDGYLYVVEGVKLPGVTSEGGGQVLRRVDVDTGKVETIAGMARVKGAYEGTLINSTFNNPTGVLYLPGRGILVSDSHSHGIRFVSLPSVDTSGLCGDEPVFDNEEQEPIQVSVDKANGHLLLPPIVLTAGGVDLQTVAKGAMRVKLNGEDFVDYALAVEETGNNVSITFGNGADGKRAWVPNADYSIKLCHQITTTDGIPIEPTEIVVHTRVPNQQENIGLSHSNGTRSGVFYLPASYDPNQEYPIALLLHGLGGNGSGMVGEFQGLADSKGVILLGPDGFLRQNPFGTASLYYFNPNHKNIEPKDYTFVASCLNRMIEAFDIDSSQTLVAGMSMGAPATLFFAGHSGEFSHAAMLHGVRWNYDPNNANDVANLLWFPWEQTPLGTHRPLFWYSTSVDDWVTNYEKVPMPGMSVEGDLAYVEGGGYNVTHKFDYPGGHWMTAQEKLDLFNWFLFGIAP